MGNSRINDLKEALVDVRKAHRLVYSFQERMLSLVSFIGNRLDLGEPSGIKHFSNYIDRYRGSDVLKLVPDMWAWDFVYSYVFQYLFEKNKFDDGSKYRLSLVQFADTGYFDSGIEDFLDIKHFATPETSISKLLFALEDIPKGKAAEFEDLSDVIYDNKVACSEHTNSVVVGKNSRLLLYSIPLERFADERSSLAALQEYLDYLKGQNIEFDLV